VGCLSIAIGISWYWGFVLGILLRICGVYIAYINFLVSLFVLSQWDMAIGPVYRFESKTWLDQLVAG
jgi:hypothetical protein